MTTEPGFGATLAPTRLGIGILLVLAIANGLYLYLFPSQAEEHYAWAIVPPASAAFIGAGYIAGVLATAAGVASRSFAPIRPLVPGLGALSLISFAATMIHADRFRWDYPPTWLWTLVYAAVPLAAGYMWVRQRRASPPPEEEHGLSGALRMMSLGLGAALLIVSVVLFIAPGDVVEEWPWPITPLLSRVFGGWYALVGVSLCYSALRSARPSEGGVVFATAALWAVLALLIPLLYESDMNTEAALYWPWIGLFLGVALGCGWGLTRALADRASSRGGRVGVDGRTVA